MKTKKSLAPFWLYFRTATSTFLLSVALTANIRSQDKPAESVPPLDPQCQAFIQALAEQNAPGWDAMAPTEARKVFSSLRQLFGKGSEDVNCEDRRIDNRIPIRIYKPKSEAKTQSVLPVVVYFHGGGWVLGDIDTHDALCRRLCHEAHCAIVSVGYRLAPEHPFPAPLDDCYDATKYTASHAAELEVDASRLIVAGDSAGGNLAAAVAIKARNLSGPKILAQVLIYPCIDPKCDTRSYNSFAQGYGLTKANMQWFWKQYLGEQKVGVYAAPGKARSLAGLPRAFVITAQYDVLRDEGEEFARKLKSAGVSVTHRRYDGMIHGFIHFAGAFDKGMQATTDIAKELKLIFQTSN